MDASFLRGRGFNARNDQTPRSPGPPRYSNLGKGGGLLEARPNVLAFSALVDLLAAPPPSASLYMRTRARSAESSAPPRAT